MTTIERIVWYEMTHAVYWEQYLSQYISNKYDWRKWCNIIMLLLSTIGVSSFSAWRLIPDGEKWIPLIVCILMAITQLFAVFQKNIVISEEIANNIRQLRLKYIEYFDQLELLYLDIHDNNLTIDEIKTRFYEIRKLDLVIENLKDCLNIKKLKRVSKRGEKESLIRLARKYNITIPPKAHGRMKIFLSTIIERLLKLLEPLGYPKK